MMPGPSDHSPRFDELLPAYALGALDGDELRELEEHVATGCPECRRQLDLWQGDLEELAAAVEPITPSATTRARILRLSTQSSAPVRPRTAAPRWLALAATVLLTLGAIAIWGVWRQARLGEETARLRMQVTALERRLEQTQADNRRLAQTLSLITAPGARAVQLTGLGSAPGAVGHTFVNPQARKAIVYAFDLPAPAPGKTYELWWIAAGRPVPAGTFDVDAHGTARVEVNGVADADKIQAWAVTVEPAGGVPQPTGEMVLKG
jgi:anti-sigma-K factor RskA